MSELDDAEQKLTQIETLQAEREKLRSETDRCRQEIRMETRKFMLQLVLALSAALGVGVALGRFWLFHT